MISAIDQFSDDMRQRGLIPPTQIIADGKLHRFSSNGKNSDKAGWYIYHGDGIPAGAYGCWRLGINKDWCADMGRPRSAAENAAYKKKIEAIYRVRKAETTKLHAEGQKKAQFILKTAKPTRGDHPYEVHKKIDACSGVMRGPWQPHGKLDCLLIPMFDSDGIIWGLQGIFPKKLDIKGTKRNKEFLYGARKTGLFFIIGQPEGAAIILLGEGYATMMTCYMATGLPAVVAFDAGNIQPVVEAIRKKYPNARIVIIGDEDLWKPELGNTGRKKAEAAAKTFGCVAVFPIFNNFETKPTDFNDLHCLEGLDVVAAQLKPAIEGRKDLEQEIEYEKSDVTAVTGVQDRNSADHTVTDGVTADKNDVASTSEKEPEKIPKENERPCYRVLDKWVEEGGTNYRPGVYYFDMTEEKNNAPSVPTYLWICSPLYVEAITSDAQDNNFGRLLRFSNTLKRWREWAMPMELWRGSGEELRGALLDMGVEIAPKARGQLADYIQTRHPKRHMHCAKQVGWCKGSFILPDKVIGANASDVVFQSGECANNEYTCAGTLEGWKTDIAARAIGNPMLMMALSAAFAGALLEKCNAESGGLHFTGDSSTGKTGLIEGACSPWGGENYKRSWKATANGMEGVAEMFNDSLLALDEISECEPSDVGAIVYALGNGRGKQRASRTGNARNVKRWRCFVLSSGERTIETAMFEGGYRIKAGQDMRLPSVPVKRRFGVWDDLHGLKDGATLTDAIKTAAKMQHGHAGRTFLEVLTRDHRDFCSFLERIKALPEFSAQSGEGQDKRVAGRLALVAMTGELVTEYGLTGWPAGEAIRAAAVGLEAWRSTRGGRGNDEKRQILERVAAFIDRHGDGRFSKVDLKISNATQFRDRAGWWRDDDQHGRVYLFTSESMREALKGFDFKRALDVLQEAGVLPSPDATGERAKPQRIDGRLVRLYSIHADKLGACHES